MKAKLQSTIIKYLTTVIIFTTCGQIVNAQWEKLETPYAATITSMIKNELGIFVTTENSGGVFFSSDNGDSFVEISDHGASNFWYDKVVSPGDNSVIGLTSFGFYKYTLENNVWKQELLNNTDTLRAHDIVYYNENLYAISYYNGVFKSADQENWNPSGNGLPGEVWCRSIKEHNDTLYLATGKGLYFSADEAVTWEIFSEDLTGKDVLNIEVTDNRLFADAWTEKNIYIFDKNRNRETISYGEKFPSSMVYFDNSLYLPLFMGGVYKLDLDTGEFSLLTDDIDIGLHTKGLWLIDNTFYLGTVGYGLFTADISFNEIRPMNNGIIGYKVKNILHHDETLLFATDYSGLFISVDEGNSWARPDSGIRENSIYDLITVNNSIIIATPGGIYRSDDGGRNWNLQSTGNITRLAYDDSFIYGSDVSYILRSADMGLTWETMTERLQDTNPYNAYYCLSAGDSVLITGTMNDGVFVSYDKGLTWEADNEGLDTKYIHIVFAHGDYIFAAQGNETVGLYRKKPGEGIWESVSDDINHPTIISMYSNENRLFISAVLSRVFFSWDNGDTWTQISEIQQKNLKYTEEDVINALTFSNNFIFASKGNGLFRHLYSDVIASIPDNPSGKNSRVNIYPNPVSGPLTISIDATEEGPCRVSILNYMGIEIAEVFKGRLSPGNNTLYLDPGKLSHGAYLMKITDNSGITVKKFLIIN